MAQYRPIEETEQALFSTLNSGARCIAAGCYCKAGSRRLSMFFDLAWTLGWEDDYAKQELSKAVAFWMEEMQKNPELAGIDEEDDA